MRTFKVPTQIVRGGHVFYDDENGPHIVSESGRLNIVMGQNPVRRGPNAFDLDVQTYSGEHSFTCITSLELAALQNRDIVGDAVPAPTKPAATFDEAAKELEQWRAFGRAHALGRPAPRPHVCDVNQMTDEDLRNVLRRLISRERAFGKALDAMNAILERTPQ